MKLLYVAPSAYLLGGVQDWLADLVDGQRQLGHDVTVAVPDDRQHRLAPYASQYPQLAPIPFRNPGGSAHGRIRALERLLLRHPDHLVVGVNIADLHPAVRRLRRAGRFRGRLVMTLHALEPEYFADLRAQRDLLDGLVVTNRLSAALARDLAALDPSRIRYAPYGVAVSGPLHAAQPSPSPAAAGPAGSSAPLRIAWVGRLDAAQKRVQDLEPILAQLEAAGVPHRLTIAGDGPARPDLEQALARRIASGSVHFAGRLPRQELVERIYPGHQVLLITSSWETGPIVAWEAMAAGLAVVSSRYVGSGLEGALIDGETALLFPVGDAGGAAAQLARLRHPQLLRKLGQAGLELVHSRYSHAASLSAWMEAFRCVSALPPLPPPARALPLPAAGGLDRLLGPVAADRLRAVLGRRFRHAEPGSEWPHSAHPPGALEPLLARAALLERAPGPGGEACHG